MATRLDHNTMLDKNTKFEIAPYNDKFIVIKYTMHGVFVVSGELDTEELAEAYITSNIETVNDIVHNQTQTFLTFDGGGFFSDLTALVNGGTFTTGDNIVLTGGDF